MIEHVMEKLIKYEFKKFYITLGYKGDLIKTYLKEKKYKNVAFISEKKPLGTAGSLSLIKNKIKKDFIVINADNIVDVDYNELAKFHKINKSDLTIVALAKQFQIPYGVCKLNDNGNFQNFIEKPKFDFLTNSGLYVCSQRILKLIKKDFFLDFNELIIRAKNKKFRIKVFPISDGIWSDLETKKNKKLY